MEKKNTWIPLKYTRLSSGFLHFLSFFMLLENIVGDRSYWRIIAALCFSKEHPNFRFSKEALFVLYFRLSVKRPFKKVLSIVSVITVTDFLFPLFFLSLPSKMSILFWTWQMFLRWFTWKKKNGDYVQSGSNGNMVLLKICKVEMLSIVSL